jgi:nucleoside-diphosphate-sugar epimerase
MKILPEAVILFGASGFVGRNIVELLKNHVPQLIAVTNDIKQVPGCNISIPISELNSLPSLPSRTVIIHVAAMRYDASSFKVDQSQILNNNVAITNTVYAFAAARSIFEVRQASSAAIYPSFFDVLDDERPFTWNDWPHEGEAAYAWSKRWGEIIAEHYRRNHAIHTLNFRISNPYGPFDTTDIDAAHVATAFAIRALKTGSEFLIRGNPDARRDFVYAGDVAQVFKASLEMSGVHDSMNLGYGNAISVYKLAEAAIAASGIDKKIVVDGASTGGVAVRQMTVAKLKRVFPDLAFKSPHQGFVETMDWYRHAIKARNDTDIRC